MARHQLSLSRPAPPAAPVQKGAKPDFPLAVPAVLEDNQTYAERKSPPSASCLEPHRGILACLPGTDHGPAQQEPKSVNPFLPKLGS